MQKKNNGQRRYSRKTETDEIVGILTAISVVSRRLARKLELLDETHIVTGDEANEREKIKVSEHAD